MVRALPRGDPFAARSHLVCRGCLDGLLIACIDAFLVLVLSRDTRARVSRTLPLHAGRDAATQRGQRRLRLLIARQNQVKRAAPPKRSSSAGRQLHPDPRTRVILAEVLRRQAVVRGEAPARACGVCSDAAR